MAEEYVANEEGKKMSQLLLVYYVHFLTPL